jgi:hypothetical protein
VSWQHSSNAAAHSCKQWLGVAACNMHDQLVLCCHLGCSNKRSITRSTQCKSSSCIKFWLKMQLSGVCCTLFPLQCALATQQTQPMASSTAKGRRCLETHVRQRVRQSPATPAAPYQRAGLTALGVQQWGYALLQVSPCRRVQAC